ncbi:uncharacterized protein BROUX77_003681 [Berkeleyomyces rouxiae]|uniref:uncharacterized protein n=1 Tax=Berkeleyomyces rouxiae TaxID=2035830 RepID=UPI003B7A2CA8
MRDGSKLGEGRVGAGWAIIRDETVLDTGNCPIPFHAEVHDAEVMAIARALEKVDSWVKPQCRKVWVCSDNLAAVYRLTTWGAKPGTSEELLRRAQTICADWIGQSPDHPGPRPWPDGAPAVEVIWVPGHSDVWGNELADRQAKMGAERAYTPVGMSLSWARSHFRARVTTEFRTWWSNEGCANRPHLSRPLEAPKKAWKNLLDDTERKLARAVLTALSGHGDYADYHRRFNHLNAVLTCPLCDAETTPEHIWTCPRNPQRMAKGFFQKLIATKSGAIWLASKAAKSPPVLLAHRRAAPKKAWTSLLDETDRNLARAVLTALSGHGDFAAYHRRFEHEDAVLSCPLCGADTSPEHIWVCHHNPQRVSSSFFQKLIGTKRGACWLAAKAAKAPTALLAHRRMRPDTQAQDAAPPAPPLPPRDGVPSGSPP